MAVVKSAAGRLLKVIWIPGKTAYIARMKMRAKELRGDRTVMTVTDLDQNDEDQHWRSWTPLERLPTN